VLLVVVFLLLQAASPSAATTSNTISFVSRMLSFLPRTSPCQL
jgi:hypothetical protein